MRDKFGRYIKGFMPESGFKKGNPYEFKKGHPHYRPAGTYKHSEETKRKISLSNSLSSSHRNQIPWNKGKKGLAKMNLETREKMSLSRKKFIINNPNNSSWKKGNIPWSKGKVFSKELRQKLSNAAKGKWLGEKNPRWNKDKIISRRYVFVRNGKHPYCNKKGLCYEHRLVVEKYIGRYLKPIEVVHHINKIKNDNRPENLILFANGGVHISFEFNKPIKPEFIIFDGRRLANECKRKNMEIPAQS